ncbi:MAG: serine/threonine protein kinase [Gemmatimonadales bacterium]|nr:serine/threonine protein kinase [Gemmatimonadales bacterium]
MHILKTGGQGAVFRATRIESSQDVALKVYSASHVEERTEREVDALRRLRGDHIVTLLESGNCIIRGTPCVWLETEFIDGEPLSTAIHRGPLEPAHVAAIVCDISAAIESMWALRVVHRDIKPDNIMIRPDGRAVLIDLGIARHVDLDSLTTVGMAWGTQGYLSPEQCRAVHSLSCKSDVFGLGVVAQEALVGRHPTARHQPTLISGGPSTVSLRPGTAAQLTAIIDRMVHRDPLRRPLPAEIISALRDFQSDSTSNE